MRENTEPNTSEATTGTQSFIESAILTFCLSRLAVAIDTAFAENLPELSKTALGIIYGGFTTLSVFMASGVAVLAIADTTFRRRRPDRPIATTACVTIAATLHIEIYLRFLENWI